MLKSNEHKWLTYFPDDRLKCRFLTDEFLDLSLTAITRSPRSRSALIEWAASFSPEAWWTGCVSASWWVRSTYFRRWTIWQLASAVPTICSFQCSMDSVGWQSSGVGHVRKGFTRLILSVMSSPPKPNDLKPSCHLHSTAQELENQTIMFGKMYFFDWYAHDIIIPRGYAGTPTE